MKYGAMNFPIKPLLEEIDGIGRMGFDYVEMTMDPPEASPQKALTQKKTIRNLLHHYGMGIVCHLPTFLLAADLYQSFREVSLKENSLALEAAAELGVKKAVLHPGYITGLAKFMPDRARGYGMESIELVLAKATALGVTLCIENMFPQTQFLSNPQDFQEVFDRLPDLRLTLDIGHANLGGGRNKSLEFVRRYGYRIAHVHVNDNFGKEDNHLPVGAGTIDFEKILRELKKASYDDTTTLEVFSKDKDYLRVSRDKVKKMWEAL